ncbi:hypothetical protein [Salinimicrobium catena]|nr:hypothetical protein [Salinimicrobium catena]
MLYNKRFIMRVLKKCFCPWFTISFLALILSCQESIPETFEEYEVSQIQSDTRLFELVSRTTLKDGSKDNILDGANNITIVLPVTVIVNGITIEVRTESDYQLIENAIEAYSDDDDEIQIKFPIDIIFSDYTQVTVFNQSELNTYISESSDEDELDEDIECINFKYPLTFEVLASNASIPTTIIVSNDAEFFALLDNLEDYIAVHLNLPIVLILSDGYELMISSLESLESAIENNVDTCDEDDDFDYDDDDEDVLLDFLTQGNWTIEEYTTENGEFTEEYNGYTFSFNSNMDVKASNDETTVSGKWNIESRDTNKLFLVLDFATSAPFEALNQKWEVTEIEVDNLELEIESELAGDLETLVFEKLEDDTAP